MPANFDSITFGAAGSHTIDIPPTTGPTGSSIFLYVVRNDANNITAPTGWDTEVTETPTSGSPPLMSRFHRYREGGDADVTFDTDSAGAAVIIAFPRPWGDGLEIGNQAFTTNGGTINLGDYAEEAVAVAWPVAGTTPVDGFALEEYANGGSELELSAYYDDVGGASTWSESSLGTSDFLVVQTWVWTVSARAWWVGVVGWGGEAAGGG